MDEWNRAELVQVEINVEFVLFLLQSHLNGLALRLNQNIS